MTFNIRFDTELDGPAGNRWHDRVASVAATLHRWAPDVVGFQEALKHQLVDLSAALPGHQGVGKPRQAGEVGEYVPLFFSTERFDAEASGDFWLSITPDVEGSLGWDAPDPRHCTWAVLRDRQDGARFAVFNTHLDVWGAEARIEGARLIVARRAIAPDAPALVIGDLNAGEASGPLDVLRGAGFVDTFRVCHPDATDVGTVHQYELPADSEKIDFVLCDRGWRVIDAAIVRDEAAGRLPSDHFPVYADVELPQ
jgi:endonuclease/exonuclease/phosphatase family metal-dependent hydrolase